MLDERLDIGRLRHAIAQISRRLRASDAAFGLTPTQASVLATVARLGPIGLTEVARREGIHPAQLSRSIGRLEADGLVRRTIDPADRRAATVAATTHGVRLLGRMRSARSDVLRGTVESLAPAEVDRLAAALPVLELLVERLHAE